MFQLNTQSQLGLSQGQGIQALQGLSQGQMQSLLNQSGLQAFSLGQPGLQIGGFNAPGGLGQGAAGSGGLPLDQLLAGGNLLPLQLPLGTTDGEAALRQLAAQNAAGGGLVAAQHMLAQQGVGASGGRPTRSTDSRSSSAYASRHQVRQQPCLAHTTRHDFPTLKPIPFAFRAGSRAAETNTHQ